MISNAGEPSSITAVAFGTSADRIADIAKSEGAVVIRGFMTPAQVAKMNSEMDVALASVKPGSLSPNEAMRAFHGSNTRRMTNLTTISHEFRTYVIDHDLLHDLGEALFREEHGDWWLCTAQLIEIGPGSSAQPLHRDLENNPPYVHMGRSGGQIISNFFIALTDFTDENGATRIIPGSNAWDDYFEVGTPEMTVPAIMSAGDVCFFTGQVVHGGGANVTSDAYRRGIAVAIQPSWLTPEEASPLVVPLDIARQLSPRAQRLLGFRSQYPSTSASGVWTSDMADIAPLLGLA